MGITGYAGEELIKILSGHPGTGVIFLSSRFDKPGKKLSEIYPHFSGLKNVNPECTSLDIDNNLKESSLKDTDVVFLALPHGASAEIASKLLKAGKKVIDLSADFRLKDPAAYKKWYGLEHPCPQLIKDAVYGLPELYKNELKKTKLAANPGCYPTSAILACAPLLKNSLVEPVPVIIDSKSGYSGGGRELARKFSGASAPDAYAYKTGGTHRHIPEIEQELSLLSACSADGCKIVFTPHVIPMERGMFTCTYFRPAKKTSVAELTALYKKFYENEPFVRVLDAGAAPHTSAVSNTNFCDIGFAFEEDKNILVVMSAIDNLVKGASGQAVQNMNLMSGFGEKDGLL